jgi:hypothetical protein
MTLEALQIMTILGIIMMVIGFVALQFDSERIARRDD